LLNTKNIIKQLLSNCFNAYFSNAHQLTNNLKKQRKTFNRNPKTPTNNNFKEIFYTNFSEEELKEAIRNTKVKKQPGPDNIFPEFIHNLGLKAMKILTTSITNSGTPEITSQTNGKKPPPRPY
jgi:hypothetical protein